MPRALLTAMLLVAILAAPVRALHGQRGAAAARPRPETAVSLVGGKLAWGKLVLGMTVKEVESVLGRGLVLRPGSGDAGCSGPEADAQSGNQRLTLTFSDAGPDGGLVDIFVLFPAPRDLREVVTALKAQVPSLQYQPSAHDVTPVPEKDNPKPLYLLSNNPGQGVLVGPSEGFWISLGCWN
jgi:hypothetical protein